MANHEYRIQRGRILKMLYVVYGEGREVNHISEGSLNLRNIALNLDDMGFRTLSSVVRGHCVFLRDRGLVTMEKVRSGELDDTQVRLTWEGVRFLENDKSDDTIDLGV